MKFKKRETLIPFSYYLKRACEKLEDELNQVYSKEYVVPTTDAHAAKLALRFVQQI